MNESPSRRAAKRKRFLRHFSRSSEGISGGGRVLTQKFFFTAFFPRKTVNFEARNSEDWCHELFISHENIYEFHFFNMDKSMLLFFSLKLKKLRVAGNQLKLLNWMNASKAVFFCFFLPVFPVNFLEFQ